MGRTKEEVYDDDIADHMTAIIAVCKEHKLQMLATFELDVEQDSPPDEPLLCTTILEFSHFKDQTVKQAADLLTPKRPLCLAEIIQTMADGSKRITISRV